MNLLGAQLAFWLGPTVPVPASPDLLEAIEDVEVHLSDEGRSGFRMTFRASRGPLDIVDYAPMHDPRLRLFSRVLLILAFDARPEVLIDGIVTNQQLSPSEEAGQSTLTIVGEDVSVMMDLREDSLEFPGQSELIAGYTIVARYATYGMIPQFIPHPGMQQPIPTERTPVFQGTDLGYLQEAASRYGYVFYVESGPAPGVNTAYLGPAFMPGPPQPSLNVNMGPYTNVSQVTFEHDGLAFELVEGQVQDSRLGTTLPIRTFASTRPPIVSQPAWLTQSQHRITQYRESGVDVVTAMLLGQARTDASEDEVVIARGELDTLSYNGLLRPRRLVGLRGAGQTYDGLYYVKNVVHRIGRGTYSQSFTLTRGGLGTITPVVIPS